MIIFGTILAADEIQIKSESVYLCTLGEWSILRHLITQMEKSVVHEWAVVLGHDNDFHRRNIEDIPVTCVVDSEWEKGFNHQAQVGLKEMPPEADGFVILPGNLPFFTADAMNRMVECLLDEKGFIIVPKANDVRFPYALFHRKFLGEVQQRLKNNNFFDIFDNHPSETYELELKNPSELNHVVDETTLEAVKAIYYQKIDEDMESNPQSGIPQ